MKLKKPMVLNNDIFKERSFSYDHEELQFELEDHLKQYGYECETNVQVDYENGRSGKGFITMVATKGDFTYGIEVSNRTPRGKAIIKLNNSNYSNKVILIRNKEIKTPYKIGDIDVIPITTIPYQY